LQILIAIARSRDRIIGDIAALGGIPGRGAPPARITPTPQPIQAAGDPHAQNVISCGLFKPNLLNHKNTQHILN
ncbi:hypothetical protein, partial [Enterobacter asburiae]